MNRLFFSTLLLCYSFLAGAQDGYIKIGKNFKLRDTITATAGEILPYVNTKDPKKINVIVNTDTITKLPITSDKYGQIPKESVNTKFLSISSSLILKNDTEVLVNGALLGKNDTLRIVSSSGEIIAHMLSSEKKMSVDLNKLGGKFYVLISEAPALFYKTNSLEPFVVGDKDGDGIIDEEDACPDTAGIESENKDKNGCPAEEDSGGFFSTLSWWHYSVFVLLLLSGAIFFIKKLRKPKGEPIKVLYNGGELSDFAKQNNIDLLTLIKYNKNCISKSYLKDETPAKNKVDEKLRSTLLIVGYKNTGVGSIMDKNPKIPFVTSSVQTSYGQAPFPTTNNEPIAWEQSETNEVNTKLDRIDKKLEEIKLSIKITQNITETDRLRQEVQQLSGDKSTLQIEKNDLQDKLRKKESELRIIAEKIMSVEYLKPYCESVLNYLALCEKVVSDAFDVFNKINSRDLSQVLRVGYLLLNFKNSINELPIGKWNQTAQDIKDTGITTNRALMRSFSLINNEQERKREFSRMLFSEALTKYSSSVLILAEAFRNLERFQVSQDLTNEIQGLFDRHKDNLLIGARSVGLEMKYIPLFKDYKLSLGMGESIDKGVSVIYRKVSGLEKDAVAEILLYGWKSEFNETKTQFIINYSNGEIF